MDRTELRMWLRPVALVLVGVAMIVALARRDWVSFFFAALGFAFMSWMTMTLRRDLQSYHDRSSH